MKQYTPWIVIIIIVLVIIGGIAWYASKPGQYDQFATCLGQNGAKFFGAFWCPHCQDQKALFGKSAAKLPYIECSTPDGQGQTKVCEEAKVEGYPTWEFKDGTRKSGLIPLQELSQLTGCPLVKDVQ